MIRPPNRLRMFESTSRSAISYWMRSGGHGLLPWRSSSRTRRPTPTAQLKIAFCRPPALLRLRGRGRVDLLEDPRHRREVVGLDLGQVGEDLQRVALPVGEHPADVEAEQLDQQREGMGERQVEVGDPPGLQHALLQRHVEHRAVVAVRDHAALGRAGRAGRVDERADVVGNDRAPPLLPLRHLVRGAALRRARRSRSRRRWSRSSGSRARASGSGRGPGGSCRAALSPRRSPPWRPSSRARTGTPRASWSGRSARRSRRR